MIDEELVSQFVRRRTLFNRVTAERKASNSGSLERLRLDSACAKCANRLLETCGIILNNNNDNDNTSGYIHTDTDGTMSKWRERIALELSCLTTAREHLSCAMNLNTRQGAGRYIDLARNACTFVRRELKISDTSYNSRRISDVYEKVQQYETQAIEQLAILTAVDVEMYIEKALAPNVQSRKWKYELYPLYECRDFKRPLTLLLSLT